MSCSLCRKPIAANYKTCWNCLPKCECGKTVKPPFTTCFTCSQDQKKDLCETCKEPFDGKKKYTQCYKCTQGSKKDTCEQCQKKFDGKGQYTKCYACIKNA